MERVEMLSKCLDNFHAGRILNGGRNYQVSMEHQKTVKYFLKTCTLSGKVCFSFEKFSKLSRVFNENYSCSRIVFRSLMLCAGS